MKARLVRVGNSRGIRLPKAVIEQAGIADEVELSVEGRRVILAAPQAPRRGWAEAAARLSLESSGLLDPETRTLFEEDEWRW